MLLYSWDGGLDVCVDLTGSSPLTQTGLADFVPDHVVSDAALLKRVKYEAQDIEARAAIHIFNMISIAIAKGLGLRFCGVEKEKSRQEDDIYVIVF
ncbi:hypothetical protein Tco_0260759 [Tanacetum coccineum]